MTRDEILNMPAGTKINQLIWWKIFEMTPTPPNNDMLLLPDYSADLSAALKVAQKFDELYIEKSKDTYFSMIGDDFETSVTCETMCLAICKTALLAVMK